MTNVPTTQTNGLPALSDADLAKMQGATPTDDIKKDDKLIPYLLLVQATSGYVQRGDKDFVEAARPGDIIDSLTREPRQRVAFVPVQFQTTYTEWKPNRGGMVRQWGSDASKYDASGTAYGTRTTAEGNDIVPSASYFGLIVFEDASTMPVVLNMSGSQFKKSRRLNSLIEMQRITKPDGTTFKPPMYSKVYALSSVQEKNELGTWFGWHIEPGSLLLQVQGGSAIFDEAQKLRDEIAAGTVQAAPAAAARNTDEIPF
jgi:hypothetical protein